MRKMLTQFLKDRIRILYLILILLICPVFMSSGTIFAKSVSQQEKQQITGTVVDANGMALPGVTILVKGTSSGAITDMDGKFTLSASATDVLIFKFVGYLSEEIPVGTSTNLDVKLVEDIIGLDEVIVTGYGVQKKSDLTGAVASISSEKLNEVPATGLDKALQGRAAGVSIMQTTGLPGSSVSVQIRGISSINGTEPLVIVDGARGTLSGLNAGDIESVEVLKDASSAAIYGATGGNGVILVKTKQGKSGKMATNFSYYRGWQHPWKKVDVMDAQEYAEYQNILIALNNQKQTRYKNLKPAWTTQPDTLENYDWQDIMFRTAIMENYDFSVNGGSEKSNYFISANYVKQQGVLNKSDWERISLRANSEHKLSKYITVGENLTFTKADRKGYQEYVFQNEYNSPVANILKMPPYLSPYDQDGKWTESAVQNPKVDEDILDYQRHEYSVGGNFYTNINLFKGFTYTSRVNAYTNFNVIDQFDKVFQYSASKQNQDNDIYKTFEQQYGWEAQNYFNYNKTIANAHNINLMAGVEARKTKFADMRGRREETINETDEMKYFDASTNDTSLLGIVKGGGWESSEFGYFGRLNYDYKSKYLITASIRNDHSSRFGPDNRSGWFPSFSAGWKFSEEEFIKDLNIIDFGKLRFGYGLTGANAASNYAYFASVSSTGTLFKYPLNSSNTPSTGAGLTRVANREIHWETIVMSNLGLDLSFLRNKLNVTVDVFKKGSEEMLTYQDLPAVAGIYQWSGAAEHATRMGGDARPLQNIGTVMNKGIEFTIGYRKMEGDLKGSVDFNATYVKNEVVSLGDNDSIYGGTSGVNLKNMCLTSEGQPMAEFNGLKTDGLFSSADAATDAEGKVYIWNQPYTVEVLANGTNDTIYAQPYAKPGDFRFIDANKDGTIDDNDRVDIGSPLPKLIIGFSVNLEYKGFDFNMFWEGKFGHKIFNASKIEYMYQNDKINALSSVLDQYRDPIYSNPLDSINYPTRTLLYEGNTDTDLPRLDPAGENKNFISVSDFYIENGAYFRMKNLQLGYTIPETLSKKVGIDKLRIYVGATNLITITKYSGFDPEFNFAPVTDYSSGRRNMTQQGIDKVGNYPQSIMYMVGVNLQF